MLFSRADPENRGKGSAPRIYKNAIVCYNALQKEKTVS